MVVVIVRFVEVLVCAVYLLCVGVCWSCIGRRLVDTCACCSADRCFSRNSSRGISSSSFVPLLWPGWYTKVGGPSRLQLALRTAVQLLIATGLPYWAIAMGYHPSVDEFGWTASDLIHDFADYSPICVIFTFQVRAHTTFPEPAFVALAFPVMGNFKTTLPS